MTDSLPLPGRGIKPLTSLLAHRGLALAVFLVVLVAGLPLAWKKGQAFYQTEASIHVAPRYMRNLREDQELDFQSNTQYRQFVEHQRKSLGRYDVLRDALAQLGERRSLWQKPAETERQAVERLRERLQVASVPDTYLLRVSLEGDRPQGLAEVVNAVTTTFIERMKSEEIFGADERSKHLRLREQELLAQIAGAAGQRSEIAQRLSLTTFNEGTPNPYDRLVADLRAKLSDARQRRMDADAALAAFKTRGDTTVNLRSVQDAVLNDPGLNSLKGALSTRRAALLVQKSGLKADHPGAVAADRELGEIDTELGRQSGRLEGGVRGNLLARLQGSADQARDVERGLQAEVGEIEAQASGFAGLFQRAMALTSDMTQARAEMDKVRERINYLGIESTSLGFLRLVSPALVPETPMGAGRRKLLLMALLAALGSALGAAVLRDLLDRRVHTVNDAHRLMGIAPAGWQVERSDSASQIFGEEQLRRLAAALIRSHGKRDQHVFGFTGCKPGAGTSSLVLELAVTLRALGYRVLAVEANGFSRDARYASGRPGLSELLRGQALAGEVIAEGTESLPPRVAMGGDRIEGRIAIERLDRLGTALADWSAEADFVLVDMPPLLVSADAELLVRSVGSVLLVVEAGAVTRGEVQRASRLLKTIDPEAVGLVVNRVAPFTAGGYLRDLMLESISGRRPGAVFTLPRWRLLASTLFLRRSRGRE
jgi:succinoglycan biosynthesis transport protein ExoP